jgi:nitric oxide reductase subunit B
MASSEWLRLPGDVSFIAGGVLPLLWLCWLGVRHRRAGTGAASAEAGTLFTEAREVEAVR